MDLPIVAASIRLGLLAGGTLAIGGMTALATRLPEGRPGRSDSRAIWVGLALLLLATGLEYAHLLWVMADGDPSEVGELWRPMLFGGVATSLIFWARIGTLLVLWAAWMLGRLLPRAGGWLGGVLLAASVAIDGHAGDRGWTSWAVLIETAHVWAAASWLGGLLLLWWRLRTLDDHAIAILRRFSALATVVYPVAVASGVANACFRVTNWGAIAQSPYGRLLILKTGAVVVVLGLAAYVRQWLLPGWTSETLRHHAHRRVLMVELAVGVLILALSSLLSRSGT